MLPWKGIGNYSAELPMKTKGKHTFPSEELLREKNYPAAAVKCVDLVGICCEYLARLEALVDKKGDRLRK